ncbi:hypothetical protein MMC11_002529 [Xylographa trunciseda]|nr:hypothetical protein [Xylographa trunciseda]
MEEGDIALYSRLTALKTLNPSLQVWISIGGWSMTDPDQPTAATFSNLAGSTANQELFFASLISFMTTYGFDGVDIDWEYPGAADRSGIPADKANYVTFLQNMRTTFQAAGHSYGVSITLPSSFWYLQNFDIVNLEKEIDWFNMMSYDLHGVWDSSDVYIGPYVAAHTNLTEIDQSLKLLWRNNIDPAKVTLGLGFYGRSFTLSDPACHTTGCEFSGGAPAGACTQSVGTLSFAEIEAVIAAGAVPVLDPEAAVQTLVYDTDNWVSYDDPYTLGLKVAYANRNCLGGTMVWAVSLDDSNGTASAALASAPQVNKYQVGIVILDQTSQCRWTNCAEACPNVLSVDSWAGGCGSGQAAYCCDPPDSNTIAPGSLLPPQPAAVTAFASLVSSWLANGQCQYDPALYSDFNKRDMGGLHNESSDKEILLARQESNPPIFSLSVTASLALIATRSGAPTVLQGQMIEVWNNAMVAAGSGYSSLSIASIQQFLTFNPLADPTELINDLLCVGPDAALWISQYSATQTEVCTADDVVEIEGSLSERAFANIADITALAAAQAVHLPGAGRLINAIGTGALRFEYFTWFEITTSPPGQRIALEGRLRSLLSDHMFSMLKKAADFGAHAPVVYSLGPNMGALDVNLQQNYGPTGGTPQPDRFAILHFHIAPAGDRGRLSVSQVNLRHGSQMRWVASSQSWRAQPSAGRGLPLISCPTGATWTPSVSTIPTSNIYSALMYAMIDNMYTTAHLFGATPQLMPGIVSTGAYTATQSQLPSFNANGGRYIPFATGDITYANNAISQTPWTFLERPF